MLFLFELALSMLDEIENVNISILSIFQSLDSSFINKESAMTKIPVKDVYTLFICTRMRILFCARRKSLKGAGSGHTFTSCLSTEAAVH